MKIRRITTFEGFPLTFLARHRLIGKTLADELAEYGIYLYSRHAEIIPIEVHQDMEDVLFLVVSDFRDDEDVEKEDDITEEILCDESPREEPPEDEVLRQDIVSSLRRLEEVWPVGARGEFSRDHMAKHRVREWLDNEYVQQWDVRCKHRHCHSTSCDDCGADFS